MPRDDEGKERTPDLTRGYTEADAERAAAEDRRAESERISRWMRENPREPDRSWRWLYVVLGIIGFIALVRFYVWSSDYDYNRIQPAVTQAVLRGSGKGTRIPVKLWWGPRILVIKSAFFLQNPRFPNESTVPPPETTVLIDVLDAKTGKVAREYQDGDFVVIVGVAIRIR